MISEIRRTDSFKKQYQKLSLLTQKKFEKQLNFLVKNPQHPSLRARKKSGEEVYEARIDRHFRFTYQMRASILTLLTIGPHDEGLGKK